MYIGIVFQILPDICTILVFLHNFSLFFFETPFLLGDFLRISPKLEASAVFGRSRTTARSSKNLLLGRNGRKSGDTEGAETEVVVGSAVVVVVVVVVVVGFTTSLVPCNKPKR